MMEQPRPIPVERFLLRAVGRTDVGAQRTQNEDAMYYDDFLGVYVVCDGMIPEHNDIFLLCCDGLNDLVDDWMIREIMTSGESLEAVAENLIRAANNNGGTDNITVVLAQTFFDPLWYPQQAYQQQMHGY